MQPDILPEPLVPQACDLSGFGNMPLDVHRLRRSKAWLICKRRPELAFYMVNLWTAAWCERPPGSLEDDDDVLADAAMCPPDRWAEIKPDVMRGWAKCSDGRQYHPVVAEKVREAWDARLQHRWQRECDRIRKENGRRKESGQPSLEYPPRPIGKSAGHPAEIRQPSAGNPSENPLKGREGKEGNHIAASAGRRPPATDPEFDLWYAAYPKHINRKAALTA